jgi:hypothetical protein
MKWSQRSFCQFSSVWDMNLVIIGGQCNIFQAPILICRKFSSSFVLAKWLQMGLMSHLIQEKALLGSQRWDISSPFFSIVHALVFPRLIGYLFRSHEQVQKGLTWNIEQLGIQNSSFWAVVLLCGESVRVFSFSMSWSSWLFESDTGWGHSYTFSVVGSNIKFDGGCILVFWLELTFGSLASLFQILLWIYVLWSKPAQFIEVCIQKASLPCSLGQVISKSLEDEYLYRLCTLGSSWSME